MILIASGSAELLGHWEHALEGIGNILGVRQFEALKQGLSRLAPRLLLLDLDLPALDGTRGVAALRRSYPAAKVIVFSKEVDDEIEVALFKLGVRGCARRDIDPNMLKRIVAAIDEGELWIRRAITPRLLDELTARARAAIDANPTLDDQLGLLTEREREIVRLIGSGESNKEIARELCITERTVKAHLTGIFRKLGVADRVRLALRVASRPDLRAERVA
jgi:two-component system NarL family response regulator